MKNYKNMCKFLLISEFMILLLGIATATIPLIFESHPIYGYKTIIGFVGLILTIVFNVFINRRILIYYEIAARFSLDSMNQKLFDIDNRLNSRKITNEQAKELKEEVCTEIDVRTLFSTYAYLIRILNNIAIISIVCVIILKSILLRKPTFFWSYSITITCCLIEICLYHLFSDKENVKTLLEKTKNFFRNIFKGKITANSKVLYFKQFLSDYSVHRLDSKFYCTLRFGNLLKDKGDIFLCPLGEGFKPANPLAHWVVEREGEFLKNALLNLEESEYDKTEFSVFIPCQKLKYRGIIFVCVDFHSENRTDINAKRIADSFLLAKKHECKKLSCPIGFLYEGSHPDTCKEFFSEFDKVIREMSDDAKNIDYLIEFVIKRSLYNYSMFKDYQDFFE